MASFATPGVLDRIWIKRAKNGPMDFVPQAALRANRGLVGKPIQGGRRQVTIIEARALGLTHASRCNASLDPSSRRANLLVRGMRLSRTLAARAAHSGRVRLEIAGETKPCHQMDEVHDGLQAVMRPNWAAVRSPLCSTTA
jgi:MOSC domain-containing protein YiiM